MSIRAIFFDFGGVLARTEDSAPRTKLAENLGLDYGRIEKVIFESESSAKASIGEIGEEQHWQNVIRALNLSESEIPRVRDEFFGGDCVDQALVDFIRSLRPQVKIGLISNAWGGLRSWIVSQKFEDAFDHMTISAEVGIMKPDARIYKHALEKLGVKAEESIFFDDMPKNVEGAKAIGMHGFVFRKPDEAMAEIKRMLS